MKQRILASILFFVLIQQRKNHSDLKFSPNTLIAKNYYLVNLDLLNFDPMMIEI